MKKGKEGNVLFNDSQHILWLYGIKHCTGLLGYREETCCRHGMGYSFPLATWNVVIHLTQTGQHIP